jgi:F-type H+-transporting ATPase subunit b
MQCVGGRRIVLASLLTLALLAGAAPVRAGGEEKHPAQKEDKAHGGAPEGAAAGGHDDHKGGDKGPNLFERATDLTIWTLVVFLLLLFILKKYAWGPMLEGLRKREETIRAAVDEAQRARLEAEKARAEFQQEMAKAQQQIPALMAEAHKRADEMVEAIRVKATEEIAADRQRLRHEIETARDQALADIWTQAAQLATLISAKAIRRELSPDDHRRLVDEALDEMRQEAANQRR